MILYGAGGHAKVIYDCLLSKGIHLAGVFDDNPDNTTFFDKTVFNNYHPDILRREKLIISIGSNKLRFNLSRNIKHDFGIVSHLSSWISERAEIAHGSMVLAKAIIQPEVRIGRHVIVNSAAIIEHDTAVDDFVHVGPGTVVCGGVTIGPGTFIGANATILPGVSLGAWSVIGAGAVVLDHVKNGSTIAGNPGKQII